MRQEEIEVDGFITIIPTNLNSLAINENNQTTISRSDSYQLTINTQNNNIFDK